MEFTNIQEALRFISHQAKRYRSEIDYYASEEYKKIYPELCRLNRLLQAAYHIRS